MNLRTTLFAAAAGLSTTAAGADVFQLAWDDEIDATYYSAHGRNVAVDAAGNVYVTGDHGTSSGWYDWITVKYDPDGNQQWLDFFDGAAGKNDHGQRVELDAAGNLYAAGISYTGGSFGEGPKFDIVVTRYTPAGDVTWRHTFNSINDADDFLEDIVVMADGSVYVVGYSYSPVGQPPDADYVVYRLSPDGELMWWTFWDGPFDRIDWLRAQAEADDSGVSIAANTEKLIGPTDADDLNVFTFVKFSPTGDQLAEGYWEPVYNEVLPDTNWLYDATLDSAGNMIMVGRYDGPYSAEQGPEEPARAVAIKFSSDGDVMWVAENDTERSDEFNQVVLDDQDNVFLCGTYNAQGPFGSHAEHLTAGYDADGNFMWEDRFGEGEQFFDGEGFAQINDAGELLVATNYFSEPYNEDIRFLRYDRTSGAVLETWAYDRGNYSDRVLDLALDPDGNMVVTGSTADTLPGGTIEWPNVVVAKVLATAGVPGDLDGDGAVGTTDFLMLLAAWGPCADPCPPACPADLDGDCTVGTTDLLALLASWG